jgi:aminoglycoside 3-N-acetyltransferase
MGTTAAQLRHLGLPRSGAVLAHVSLRRLGVIGRDAAALLEALQAALGPEVTLVVPAQTPNNSTTSRVFRTRIAGLDADQVAEATERIVGFDHARTPSYGVGAFAEQVRLHPLAIRSDHPQTSFAALGPRAADLMARHDLECHLGEQSPLGALYRCDADILLLGGFEGCTALHLAEYRLPWPAPMRPYQCFVQVGGERVQLDFDAADLDDGDFARLGMALDAQPFVRRGRLGEAQARVFPVRAAVDFAVAWMTDHRAPAPHHGLDQHIYAHDVVD